jgi:hypothetical protein
MNKDSHRRQVTGLGQAHVEYVCIYVKHPLGLLSWPLSSNSRYKSKNDADEAVSVVSLLPVLEALIYTFLLSMKKWKDME